MLSKYIKSGTETIEHVLVESGVSLFGSRDSWGEVGERALPTSHPYSGDSRKSVALEKQILPES